MPPKTDSYVMQNFFRRLLQDIAPGITVKYVIVISPKLLTSLALSCVCFKFFACFSTFLTCMSLHSTRITR